MVKIKEQKFNFRQQSIRDLTEKDGFYITVNIPGTQAATATNYSVFFVASKPVEVISVSEAHTTAGSDAGAVELNIERLSSTEALGSGDEILVTDFDLKGTADTVVKKQGITLQNTQLRTGDRLALKDTGALTNVAGVCVTLYLIPSGKGNYE